MSCSWCGHNAAQHGDAGCLGCEAECPFGPDGNMAPLATGRYVDARPRHCPGHYKITSGPTVWCDRPPNHPGGHEGYCPGDAHRSHWRNKKVKIEAAPDEPRCNSHHRDAPGDQRCIKPAEHHAEHRTGFGHTDLCWYDHADGVYVPVANPDRTKATRDEQVGGNHYRQFKIQPWEIWEEYGLDAWQANTLKYLLRAGRKEGVKASQDYRKAIHYLQYLVERAEAAGE